MPDNPFDMLLGVLIHATVALSAGIAVVLLARPAVQRWYGAQLVYALWLIVPAAAAASWLPAAPALTQRTTEWMPALQLASLHAPAAATEGLAWGYFIVPVWLVGALLAAAWCWRQHRGYLRTLGRLTESEGLLFSDTGHCGPALVGIWAPKIVLPADFKVRYAADEQPLILAHERMHRSRGDIYARLLCAAAQCLFWFNPLVHFGAHRCRLDQELACDAAVMLAYPNARRPYAQALLKTQLAVPRSPAACCWQSNHPLKERIMLLNRTRPSLPRRLGGAVLIAGLISTAGLGAWAAAPQSGPIGVASSGMYELTMTIDVDGAVSSPRIRVKAGDPFGVAFGDGAARWSVTSAVQPGQGERATLDFVIKHGYQVVDQRHVPLELGDKVRIWSDSRAHRDAYAITVVVHRAATVAP